MSLTLSHTMCSLKINYLAMLQRSLAQFYKQFLWLDSNKMYTEIVKHI